MASMMLDDLEPRLSTSRVRELSLERGTVEFKRPPGEPFNYAVTMTLGTQARLGVVSTKDQRLAVLSMVTLTADFKESEADGAGIYAKLRMVVEGAFVTDADPPKDPGATVGPRVMKALSRALIAVCDVHVRQVLAMAQLPFAIEQDRMIALSQNATLEVALA